jgi:hypothetical protein
MKRVDMGKINFEEGAIRRLGQQVAGQFVPRYQHSVNQIFQARSGKTVEMVMHELRFAFAGSTISQDDQKLREYAETIISGQQITIRSK